MLGPAPRSIEVIPFASARLLERIAQDLPAQCEIAFEFLGGAWRSDFHGHQYVSNACPAKASRCHFPGHSVLCWPCKLPLDFSNSPV
jgi:hypothetical protein